jgi:hypothetical protein
MAFKGGGHCAAGFSSKKSFSERYLAGLKTGEIASGRFSKALGPAVRNLVSIERRI